MNIDLSIIIPVFNNEISIKKCIKSIVSQKTPIKYEIIIIDDGSTDNTVQIIKKLYFKYNNLTLISQKNQGAGAARNTALQYAKGKYIFFIDGDDYISSNCFNILHKEIIKNDDLDIIVFLYKYYDETDNKIKNLSKRDSIVYNDNALRNEIFSFKSCPQILECIAYPWNKIYLRSFIIDNNLKFSETKVHNDILFNISNYIKAKKIKIINKYLYIHTIKSKKLQLTQIFDYRRLDVLNVFKECEYFLGQTIYYNSHNIDYIIPYTIFKLNLIDWIITRANSEIKQILISYVIQYLLCLDNKILIRLTSHRMMPIFIRNLMLEHNLPHKENKSLSNSILLSIIVPVYNVEKYLHKCLQSIANQTLNHNDYEVILVDDKSTDKSIDICREFISNFSNFHLIELPKNTIGGAGTPSNIGLEYAKGKYIGFIDSDDYIEPGMFQAMLLRAMETDADLTICDFKIYNHNNKKISFSYDQKAWQYLRYAYYKKYPLRILKQKVLALSPVPWRKLYRKDFLDKFHIRYPEGNFFYEDNPLHWFSVVHANSIAIIDTPFVTHRLGRKGQTMDIKPINLLSFITHGNIILNFLKSINKYEEYKIEYLMWIFKQSVWILPKLGELRKKYVKNLRLLCKDITNEDINKYASIYKHGFLMKKYILYTIKGHYFISRFIKKIMKILYT